MWQAQEVRGGRKAGNDVARENTSRRVDKPIASQKFVIDLRKWTCCIAENILCENMTLFSILSINSYKNKSQSHLCENANLTCDIQQEM